MRSYAAACLLPLGCLLILSSGAANGQTIFSDFGLNNSFSTNGWCVSGPNNPDCGSLVTRWIAAPFTPGITSNLASIAIALGNISGTNGAAVSLVNSSGGGPGTTVLESWTISSLPKTAQPTVTTLVSGVHPALQGGQTYWIQVLPAAADTMDYWFLSGLGLSGGLNNIASGGWTGLVGYNGQTLPAYSVAVVPPPPMFSDFGVNNSFSQSGWCVSGAKNGDCGGQVTRLIAAPFTPSDSWSLSSITLALGNISGTNGTLIRLLPSSAGAPDEGHGLEQWTVYNLPSTSQPTLTKLTSQVNPSLQAGQTYWVAVEPLADDSMDLWYVGGAGPLSGGLANIGNAGWTPLVGYNGQTLPAFSVSGVQITVNPCANEPVALRLYNLKGTWIETNIFNSLGRAFFSLTLAGSDTGFVDLTPHLSVGVNHLSLSLLADNDTPLNYAYGYQVRKGSTIVDQGSCGVSGSSTCTEGSGLWPFSHDIYLACSPSPSGIPTIVAPNVPFNFDESCPQPGLYLQYVPQNCGSYRAPTYSKPPVMIVSASDGGSYPLVVSSSVVSPPGISLKEWLTVTPAYVFTPYGVTLPVDPSGLKLGNYMGYVSASLPPFLPVNLQIPLNLTVPADSTSPLTGGFGYVGVPAGLNATLGLDLTTNPLPSICQSDPTGVITCNVQVTSVNSAVAFSAVASTNDGASWLSVISTVPAVPPATLTIRADPTNLSPGIYFGYVQLSRIDGTGSDLLNVTLTAPTSQSQ